MSLECLTAVVVEKCSSIRELSTDMKASNCSWHLGRRYSENQLMAVRSAANVRMLSVVTCRVVLIAFLTRPVLSRCPQTWNNGDYVIIRFS